MPVAFILSSAARPMPPSSSRRRWSVEVGVAVAQVVKSSPVACRLIGSSMLEVAEGGDERAGRDGVARSGLFRRIRAVPGRGRFRRGDPARDTTGIHPVRRAEDGAARDGLSHAAIEGARGSRGLTEPCA